jgi:GDP-L-fucose synthase
MKKTDKIYVAGHHGLVGSALVRTLEADGYTNILTRTREMLDLTNQQAVADFFAQEKPVYVFLAAARVGGIMENKTYPAEFIYQNLMIETNIIHQAYVSGVTKLLFLGSSCIYPKLAKQPIKEEYLMTGALEPSNKAYATAKIAGIEMCASYNEQYGTNFISAMPTNLYGPNDNFDLTSSHVLPALIRKFHEAKERGEANVTLWGTGSPRREFLHVDDLARACVFLMERHSGSEPVNVGTGEDITIRELGEMVAEVVGYTGELVWDTTKPDGTPRKLLDVSRLKKVGWTHTIALRDGITSTYQWFLNAKSWA